MPPIQFVVDRRAAGQTLASVLKARFGLSWAQAKRLVEKGHVRVSGQVETDVARRLKLGKRVELAAGTVENKGAEAGRPGAGDRGQKTGGQKPEGKKPPAKKPDVPPARPKAKPGLPPEVLVYVDDAVAVVNKPAGLTTMRHKDEADEFGAHGQRFLTRTLAGMLPGLLGTPDRAVTAVHRLDRDTSGLVVFARTRAAGEHLTEQFRRHRTERRYLALTRGTPAPGRVASVFVADRGDGRRGSTADLAADGKRAVTHVAVVEELGPFALVECRLETGRTHQVRIHLGEAGAPLCGEAVYDRPPDGPPLPDASGAARPMLHAARLGFVHPDTGAAMSWQVDPPADFQALLATFRRAARSE